MNLPNYSRHAYRVNRGGINIGHPETEIDDPVRVKVVAA